MSTIDIKHTTGERLVQLREKFGMSQAQVASTIGVDRTSYAKYEANVNRPTRKLKELSELFNVTSDYIMCLSEFPYNEPFAGQDDGQHIVPDGQIFAIRLRTLLHEHNDLPQSELAKQVGVSHQVVEDWAYCKRMPDYSTLLKLAAYFNVTTDYLLGLTDTPTTPAGSPAMYSSAPGGTQGSAEGADEQPPQQKEYVELHRIIDNLSHEDVKELLNSARYKQNLADKKREYVDDPDDF